MPVKQVIVIRKDLKMRRGKEIAQGSHASMAFLSNRIRKELDQKHPLPWAGTVKLLDVLHLSEQEIEWIKNSFAKVTVRVNSEEELMEVKQKAEDEGLVCELIVDSGKTEFDGVPTPTCIAIGPDDAEKIDKVTGDLKLY